MTAPPRLKTWSELPPAARDAAKIVGDVLGIEPQEFMVRARPQRLADARFILFWVLISAGHTPAEVGEWYGRERGGVRHGVQAVQDLRATDASVWYQTDIALGLYREIQGSPGLIPDHIAQLMTP